MADEPIPLYDGEPSGAEIIPERPSGTAAPHAVRCRRRNPRRDCEQVHVCFSPLLESGQTEHVECPLINISASGLAIEYDRPLAVGVTGHITYRTVSHEPVRVSCHVQRCEQIENGTYLLGIKLDRELKFEELKPARMRRGRELADGIRARKLRPSETKAET